MYVFLYVVIALLLLLIILVLIAPKSYNVSRSITVNKSLPDVFLYLKFFIFSVLNPLGLSYFPFISIDTFSKIFDSVIIKVLSLSFIGSF